MTATGRAGRTMVKGDDPLMAKMMPGLRTLPPTTAPAVTGRESR